MTEDQLQAACWQWAWNTYPEARKLLWAVPNGGDRRIVEAQKFKATGVIAGVHDLHLFWKGKFYTFELKVGANRLSQAQLDWGALVRREGGKWFEVRELEEFKILFRMIMSGVV